MFHLKIFELIDWVPTDRNIYIYIYTETNFVIDTVCSNIRICYAIVQKSVFFIWKMFFGQLISIGRIKREYVKKYTNILTLSPIILYDDRWASKWRRQKR
jgi:hypothetical protein